MSEVNQPNVGTIQTYGILRRVGTIPEPDRPAFFVQGREAVADDGMGLFGWDPASTDADDDDAVIRPNDRASTAGRWKKL